MKKYGVSMLGTWTEILKLTRQAVLLELPVPSFKTSNEIERQEAIRLLKEIINTAGKGGALLPPDLSNVK